MLKITVTGSKWVDGSGWAYTEDLDPMEVDSLDEVEKAAGLYAAEFLKNYTPAGEGEDYQLRFYADEGQQDSLVTIWIRMPSKEEMKND